MSIADLGLWQWLALIQHELLLFAGIFFLIGAADDIAVDALWLWLRLTGKATAIRRKRAALVNRPLHGPAAVLIPAWNEAAVIGQTVAHILASWPHPLLRLYVGCYRNDPATLAAASAAAKGDPRLRLVIHDRDGPSTKADCLNRLYSALATDEARSGRRYAMVVFHDAEDMVDPAALGLLDEAVAFGADFVQLPVEPLVQHHGGWFATGWARACQAPAWAARRGVLRSTGWQRPMPMACPLPAIPSPRITSSASASRRRAAPAASCGCAARTTG